jgi:hypothetical protein
MAKKKAQNIPLPFISILKMRRVKIQIQRKNIPSHTGKNTLLDFFGSHSGSFF